MKEYKVHELRKTRSDLGKCLACGNEIKKGELYRHAYVSGGVILFCANCPVNQSLIGKNRDTSTDTPTPKATELIKEEIKTEVAVEPNEEAPVESKKPYCSKCKGTHEIGSRRYKQHKAWLS